MIENQRMAKEMGRNGAQRVRELYSWDVVGERTLRLYEQVLREYSSSPWKPKKFARKSS